MIANPTLKSVRQLLLRKVVLTQAATPRPGLISQVFLHPSEGTLLGLEIQIENEAVPLLIALKYLLFINSPSGKEPLAALADSFVFVDEFQDGATTYQDFLNADIVTGEGKLCGQVQDVYFDEESLRTVYEVRMPGLRGLFRKEYFIVGSNSDFYSHKHRRLILPSATPRFDSLTAVAARLQLAAPVTSLAAPASANNFSKTG
jgi:hypothetical protein